MELVKDYDCAINYHLGMANMVADALSRKSSSSISMMKMVQKPLLFELLKLEIEIVPMGTVEILSTMSLQLILLKRIKHNQLSDQYLNHAKDKAELKKTGDF